MLLRQSAPLLADHEHSPVPGVLRVALTEQLAGLRALTERIEGLERQIASWQCHGAECQRITAIPGVGVLTATAAIATVGGGENFWFRPRVCCIPRSRVPDNPAPRAG
jgi:transposase